MSLVKQIYTKAIRTTLTFWIQDVIKCSHNHPVCV